MKEDRKTLNNILILPHITVSKSTCCKVVCLFLFSIYWSDEMCSGQKCKRAFLWRCTNFSPICTASHKLKYLSWNGHESIFETLPARRDISDWDPKQEGDIPNLRTRARVFLPNKIDIWLDLCWCDSACLWGLFDSGKLNIEVEKIPLNHNYSYTSNWASIVMFIGMKKLFIQLFSKKGKWQSYWPRTFQSNN